jgi:chromate transporter
MLDRLRSTIPILDRLRSLAGVFLKLGTIGFGGPIAHLGLIEREVVEQRAWLTKDRLLDLISIANLIPGPSSTEVVIQVGYLRAGTIGAIVAGTCFILPGMLVVWGLAIGYDRVQDLPQVGAIFLGMKPAIVAAIGQSLYRLGKSTISSLPAVIIAIAVLICCGWFGANEIWLLALAGLGMVIWGGRKSLLSVFKLRSISSPVIFMAIASKLPTSISLSIFWIFLKIGAVIYGGGYVLYAVLQQELVERDRLLTAQQLFDAIAIGQVTPGPLFTTATFIGYLLAGNSGAIVATIGIFLPGLLYVCCLMPIVSKLRQSFWFQNWLMGINAGSWALMAIVAVRLGLTMGTNWLSIALTGIFLILLIRCKIDLIWLIAIGGAIGYGINMI